MHDVFGGPIRGYGDATRKSEAIKQEKVDRLNPTKQ